MHPGDEVPKRQAARQIPFIACKEVAEQLEEIQGGGGYYSDINESLVKSNSFSQERDGTLLFCVDYRALTSVTKPDLFP